MEPLRQYPGWLKVTAHEMSSSQNASHDLPCLMGWEGPWRESEGTPESWKTRLPYFPLPWESCYLETEFCNPPAVLFSLRSAFGGTHPFLLCEPLFFLAPLVLLSSHHAPTFLLLGKGGRVQNLLSKFNQTKMACLPTRPHPTLPPTAAARL